MVKVITLLALILGAVDWAQTQKLKSIQKQGELKNDVYKMLVNTRLAFLFEVK